MLLRYNVLYCLQRRVRDGRRARRAGRGPVRRRDRHRDSWRARRFFCSRPISRDASLSPRDLTGGLLSHSAFNINEPLSTIYYYYLFRDFMNRCGFYYFAIYAVSSADLCRTADSGRALTSANAFRVTSTPTLRSPFGAQNWLKARQLHRVRAASSVPALNCRRRSSTGGSDLMASRNARQIGSAVRSADIFCIRSSSSPTSAAQTLAPPATTRPQRLLPAN